MGLDIALAQWKSSRVVKRARKVAMRVLARSAELEGLEDIGAEFARAVEKDDVVLGLACARIAVWRETGLWLHLEQVMGAVCLVWGHIAEMRTGEGKTLTVVGAAAWWARKYGQVHVVTANSYLARRDADKLRGIYGVLGLKTGVVEHGQSVAEKKESYGCEVVYGVGHEFGFDYLRDSLALDEGSRVQRGRVSAIVDEIDSVLIDDAKTPMILANKDTGGVGPLEADAKLVDGLVRSMVAGVDYRVDLKKHEAEILEAGFDGVERALISKGVIGEVGRLYAGDKMYLLAMLNHALSAHVFLKAGRDYVVEGGRIVLVDLGTGRKMEGRRLSEGLHEALEAKEGVAVAVPTKVQGSVTYQNFFGGYRRLSGLSGTVLSDADEFAQVYGLSVCVIPTHRPIRRVDRGTVLYATKLAKFEGAAHEVAEVVRTGRGRPVLVGCGSVRDARVMSMALTGRGVEHELLTAANEAREAEIISGAGRLGAVTVATNMAGRGTDILLGGGDAEQAQEVRALGGLLVLVTEHSDVMRVDAQFAGRSGRQGDPGEVVFYCSLEDDIFERFADKGGVALLRRLAQGMGGSELGAHGPVVSKYIGMAQRKAQGEAQAARRDLAKFDELMSKQRDAVFEVRACLLRGGDELRQWCHRTVLKGFEGWLKMKFGDRLEVDWLEVQREVCEHWGAGLGKALPAARWVLDGVGFEEGVARSVEVARRWYFEDNKALWEDEAWVAGVGRLALGVVDEGFSAHVGNMDELRKNKGVRQHGSGMNLEFLFYLDAIALFESYSENVGRVFGEELAHLIGGGEGEVVLRKYASGDDLVAKALWDRWVGRNEACPCGSGLAYKKCHGVVR